MSKHWILIAGLCGLAGAAADTVTVGGGQPIEGQVVELTYRTLKLKRGVSFRWGSVRAVVLDQMPQEYEQGERARARGDHTTALVAYRKALVRCKDLSIPRQFPRWRIARTEAALGRADDAERTLRVLLAEDPQTIYLLEANLLAGRIALARGNLDAAARTLEAIHQRVTAREPAHFSAAGRAQAVLWLARARLAAGRAEQALELFESVRGARPLAREAAVGRGWALLRLGRKTEAAGVFRQVIAGAATPERRTLARACNGLGESLLERDPARALKAFLKVTELFGEQITEQPSALLHAAACFERLAQGNRSWSGRARTLRVELARKHPAAPWRRPGWREAGLP